MVVSTLFGILVEVPKLVGDGTIIDRISRRPTPVTWNPEDGLMQDQDRMTLQWRQGCCCWLIRAFIRPKRWLRLMECLIGFHTIVVFLTHDRTLVLEPMTLINHYLWDASGSIRWSTELALRPLAQRKNVSMEGIAFFSKAQAVALSGYCLISRMTGWPRQTLFALQPLPAKLLTLSYCCIPFRPHCPVNSIAGGLTAGIAYDRSRMLPPLSCCK